MNIFGTLISIVIAAAITILLWPVGGIILSAVIFVLVLNMHARNKQMYEDIQKIKEKLGIEDRDDFNLSDEEIEEELERELNGSQNDKVEK